MRFFACLLDPKGQGTPASVLTRYERLPRSRGLDFQWRLTPQAAALVAGDEPATDPLVAIDGDSVAVGMVRLDNRTDLERWSGSKNRCLTDLELVLRTVAHHGTKYVPQFLGEFAFVAWSAATRTGVAAVDAFALKKLYWTQRDGLLTFASRAEAVALDEGYDVQCLSELVGICSPSPELTAYAGVKCVPPASMALLDRRGLAMHQYWSPNAVEPEPACRTSPREAAEACRQLLTDAVRLRLVDDGSTWAQLSGGIDSSSVVSVAQSLVESGRLSHGLAGTVTYADREGSAADERRYSDIVAKRWQLRNETIVDPPFWIDAASPPPQTDLPRFTLPFYPRERRLCAIVGGARGRVLLTGVGGDELFTGTMLFFADWVARGRILPAVREMARRAIIGRVSFWQLAYRNSLLPLLPRSVQYRLLRDEGAMPPWLSPGLADRYDLRARTYAMLSYGGRLGHKCHDTIAAHVAAIGTGLDFASVIGDALDLRHPFLYRPLVEFALRLPPELLAQPNARKWILREAMRGILPDEVRTRVGKGGPAELFASALTAQRRFLEPLVKEPILADLGVVDGLKLRAAFELGPGQPHRRNHPHAVLHFTLAIEAWLQLRSGRWPRETHVVSTAPSTHAYQPSV
jgi:asparagine synthase (glutamine-hydrolysing)